MSCLHHFQPLSRRDLVRADDFANLVIEDFGSRAGQSRQARGLELQQVILKRHTKRRRTLPDFERRESMYVHLRYNVFNRAKDFKIGFPGVTGMNTALHAQFGCTAIPCFDGTAPDLIEVEIIRIAA